MQLAHDVGSDEVRTGDVTVDDDDYGDFTTMMLPQPLLEGLASAGYRKPSPVQFYAMPPASMGAGAVALLW